MYSIPKKTIITVVVSVICALVLLAGCASPMPKSSGKPMVWPVEKGHPYFHSVLQMRWLGTSAYLIQLGDVAILTDPFFTYQPLPVVLCGEVRSDPDKVAKKLSGLAVADAMFVGHSHYDHMLDLIGTIRHTGWRDVPVYGSHTLRNIMCGYGEEVRNWRCARPGAGWQHVVPGLEFMALRAEHAPHFRFGDISLALYDGRVDECLPEPPRRAGEFKVGDTYAYLFRLSNHHVEGLRPDQRRSFTVYMAGAASNFPIGLPDEAERGVDVAILCVPAWRNVSGYPGRFIDWLRPRHVVLSHYDNFFQTCGCCATVVPTADLPGFMRVVRCHVDYPTFEEMHTPRVDDVMYFQK